jgi:enoyl-CoA hydratase/carnithine racemase
LLSLGKVIAELARSFRPLIIPGNEKFFSAGADLNEIASFAAPDAFEFSRAGQLTTDAVDDFLAQVIAVPSTATAWEEEWIWR